MDTKEELKTELLRIAREEFPKAAREGRYPIRFDHCMLRVVYDHLYGAQWQTVLKKGPAIHQLSEVELKRAVEIARQITAEREVCKRLNRQSLKYRGKLKS